MHCFTKNRSKKLKSQRRAIAPTAALPSSLDATEPSPSTSTKKMFKSWFAFAPWQPRKPTASRRLAADPWALSRAWSSLYKVRVIKAASSSFRMIDCYKMQLGRRRGHYVSKEPNNRCYCWWWGQQGPVRRRYRKIGSVTANTCFLNCKTDVKPSNSKSTITGYNDGFLHFYSPFEDYDSSITSFLLKNYLRLWANRQWKSMRKLFVVLFSFALVDCVHCCCPSSDYGQSLHDSLPQFFCATLQHLFLSAPFTNAMDLTHDYCSKSSMTHFHPHLNWSVS